MKDGEGDGADNIAIGTEALKNIGAGAARNIAIGGDAQKIQNGAATDNISIGYQSLYNNTVGDYNVAVGTEALYSVNNPSGHKNVGVGYRAGLFIANGSTEFTSGSSNVFIGAHAYPNAINDSNEVVIGANAIGKGSNTVTIGDDNITDIYLSEDVGATVHTGNVSGSAASTGSFGALDIGGEKIRASSTGLLIGNDNTGPHNSEEVSIVGAIPLSIYANAGGGRPVLFIQNQVGDSEGPNLAFRKSRNTTLGSHTIVQDGDDLGQITWNPSDGNSWEMAARIKCTIDGSPGNADLPTEMKFGVAADGAQVPTDRLTISAAGTVSGDLNDTSDRTLKKNIVPLEDSTEKVKKLNPVTFDWEDTGIGSIGFIAQEIEELYPDAVRGKEGKKSIKISGIVAALTKTVQSLIEKNEALEKRIKDLENN
jgi:hypothetical protein